SYFTDRTSLPKRRSSYLKMAACARLLHKRLIINKWWYANENAIIGTFTLFVLLPHEYPLDIIQYPSSFSFILAKVYRLLIIIRRSKEHTSELQSRFDLVC